MRFRRMTAKRGFRGRATEGRPKCSATWDTEPSKSLYSFGCRVRCGENRYDVSFGRVADLLHPPPFSLSGSPFVRGAAERGRTSEGRSCIRPPVIPFGRKRVQRRVPADWHRGGLLLFRRRIRDVRLWDGHRLSFPGSCGGRPRIQDREGRYASVGGLFPRSGYQRMIRFQNRRMRGFDQLWQPKGSRPPASRRQ